MCYIANNGPYKEPQHGTFYELKCTGIYRKATQQVVHCSPYKTHSVVVVETKLRQSDSAYAAYIGWSLVELHHVKS